MNGKTITEFIQGFTDEASCSACEMEVPPLLTKMSVATAFLATRIVAMVSLKYSVFLVYILYHVGQSALCDVTKTSS